MLDFNMIMAPIWDSDIIYDESLTMVCEQGICEAPLLYEPEEILWVTSADKTRHYEKDRDWVCAGRMFTLTPDSRIFRFQADELVFDDILENRCFRRKDGRYSFFSEGHFFHDRQICVTYRKKTGKLNIKPKFCGHLLPRFMEKMLQAQPTKIVLYGDSISEGANSSGMTATTPFQPSWGLLVAEKLRRYYGAPIKFVNTAVGGKDAKWGVENAESRVATYEPDLAIIAFGMNDTVSGNEFAERIRHIINCVREISPYTEFLLCGTSFPNRELCSFFTHQDEHAAALKEMEQEGIAVADFGSMQEELLKTKRFIDMTGNNVNHPNDFFIRCQAQLLAGLLIQDANR